VFGGRLAGIGPFVGAATVFFVIGVLAVLLEIQSPSFVLWSGIKVQGTTYGGLTHYTYGGEKFAIDNTKAEAGDQRHVPTTVWLNRGDPTDSNNAYIENPFNRWLDFSIVVMWFFVAGLILAAGFLTRWRRRRRRIEVMGEFGAGISDEFVRRMLQDRREAAARPTITFDE
jgi:hypothetical protein